MFFLPSGYEIELCIHDYWRRSHVLSHSLTSHANTPSRLSGFVPALLSTQSASLFTRSWVNFPSSSKTLFGFREEPLTSLSAYLISHKALWWHMFKSWPTPTLKFLQFSAFCGSFCKVHILKRPSLITHIRGIMTLNPISSFPALSFVLVESIIEHTMYFIRFIYLSRSLFVFPTLRWDFWPLYSLFSIYKPWHTVNTQ